MLVLFPTLGWFTCVSSSLENCGSERVGNLCDENTADIESMNGGGWMLMPEAIGRFR